MYLTLHLCFPHLTHAFPCFSQWLFFFSVLHIWLMFSHIFYFHLMFYVFDCIIVSCFAHFAVVFSHVCHIWFAYLLKFLHVWLSCFLMVYALGCSVILCLQWHLGFVAKEYTPPYRGYDTFLGFVGGKDDYWDHSRYEGTAKPVCVIVHNVSLDKLELLWFLWHF